MEKYPAPVGNVPKLCCAKRCGAFKRRPDKGALLSFSLSSHLSSHSFANLNRPEKTIAKVAKIEETPKVEVETISS